MMPFARHMIKLKLVIELSAVSVLPLALKIDIKEFFVNHITKVLQLNEEL